MARQVSLDSRHVLLRRYGCRREGGRAVRSIGKPIADVVGPHPFAAWQQAFDPLLTPGARDYWKTHDFAELSDTAIESLAGGQQAA